MCFHDVLHNGKTEATSRSSCPHGSGTIETPENMRKIGCCDARTGISDFDTDPGRAEDGQRNAHRASFRRVLHGVIEKIHKCALETVPIRLDLYRFRDMKLER